MSISFSCSTIKVNQVENTNLQKTQISDVDDLNAGNTSDGTGAYDGSGDGVFGRKIIYRDMSAAKSATTVSGKVSVKVCINRAGLVTYVELNNTETTIRDKQTLEIYLKAARGYKFQPDLTAPKEQCGKMSFKLENTLYNK